MEKLKDGWIYKCMNSIDEYRLIGKLMINALTDGQWRRQSAAHGRA